MAMKKTAEKITFDTDRTFKKLGAIRKKLKFWNDTRFNEHHGPGRQPGWQDKEEVDG